MAAECFPAITRCFSSKNMKMELKLASPTSSSNKRSDSSMRSSFRTTGSTSSRSFDVTSPPPKRPWEEEMRDVFRHFDSDSDGKISPSELRAYFASVGEHISNADAQGVIDHLDSDGDGLLGFEDFLSLMGTSTPKEKGSSIEVDSEGDMKKVFEMFEQDKGSGRITPRGLQRMLGRLGDSKSYDECAAMIQIYDIDGDGQLDFQEFNQMMS